MEPAPFANRFTATSRKGEGGEGGEEGKDGSSYVQVQIAPQAIGPGEARHSVHVIVDRDKAERNAKRPRFQTFRLGRPVCINGAYMQEAHVVRLLWEHGLSRCIPLVLGCRSTTPLNPRTASGDFSLDNAPACYAGPRAWPFAWKGAIPCSLAWDNQGLYVRIHDLDPATGEAVLADIYEALWQSYVASLPVKTTPIVYVRRPMDNPCTRWGNSIERPGRTLETIYLDESLKRATLDGLKRFLESRDLYERYGVTWKRVHLLEGPPGTGKTSFVLALATALGYGICKMTVTPRMTSVDLENLFAGVPAKFVLLLEDVDALFAERAAGTVGGTIDFSTLLNCLDGVETRSGLIAFLTTNHAHRLDSALVRPGRVDVRIRFDAADERQCLAALESMGERWTHEHREFLRAVGDIPMASLQRHLFECIQLNKPSLLVREDLEALRLAIAAETIPSVRRRADVLPADELEDEVVGL